MGADRPNRRLEGADLTPGAADGDRQDSGDRNNGTGNVDC